MICKTPTLEHRSIAENKHEVECFCAITSFSEAKVYKCLFSGKYQHSELLENETLHWSEWDRTLLTWWMASS